MKSQLCRIACPTNQHTPEKAIFKDFFSFFFCDRFNFIKEVVDFDLKFLRFPKTPAFLKLRFFTFDPSTLRALFPYRRPSCISGVRKMTDKQLISLPDSVLEEIAKALYRAYGRGLKEGRKLVTSDEE